jgi:hypothetical protein
MLSSSFGQRIEACSPGIKFEWTPRAEYDKHHRVYTNVAALPAWCG